MNKKIPSADSVDVRKMFEDCSGHFTYGEKAVEIIPGDWYWAKRNGPARILKCRSVNDNGWVCSITASYPYDISECYRLRSEFSENDIILIAIQAEVDYDEWIRVTSKMSI